MSRGREREAFGRVVKQGFLDSRSIRLREPQGIEWNDNTASLSTLAVYLFDSLETTPLDKIYRPTSIYLISDELGRKAAVAKKAKKLKTPN